MSDKKCCARCYKRNVCVGSGWYCNMCDKDRQTCEFYRSNEGEPITCESNNIEINCNCKSC